MRDGGGNVIDYAGAHSDSRKPTRHSTLAAWSWGVLVLETLFRGVATAVAHLRSPTYPWARFSRNVGDPDLFIWTDRSLLVLGVALAVLALLRPHRKRWAALAALAAHVLVLVTKYDLGLSLIRR